MERVLTMSQKYRHNRRFVVFDTQQTIFRRIELHQLNSDNIENSLTYFIQTSLAVCLELKFTVVNKGGWTQSPTL